MPFHAAGGNAGGLLESGRRMTRWGWGWAGGTRVETCILLPRGVVDGGRAFGRNQCTAALPGRKMDTSCHGLGDALKSQEWTEGPCQALV